MYFYAKHQVFLCKTPSISLQHQSIAICIIYSDSVRCNWGGEESHVGVKRSACNLDRNHDDDDGDDDYDGGGDDDDGGGNSSDVGIARAVVTYACNPKIRIITLCPLINFLPESFFAKPFFPSNFQDWFWCPLNALFISAPAEQFQARKMTVSAHWEFGTPQFQS